MRDLSSSTSSGEPRSETPSGSSARPGSSPPPRAAAGSSPSPRRWEASPTCSWPPRTRPSEATSAGPGRASPRCARATRRPPPASPPPPGPASPSTPPPLAELDTALSGISLLRERTPRVTDLVASFGERLSAPLVAAALSATRGPGARRRRADVPRHRREARHRDLRPEEDRPAGAAHARRPPREGNRPGRHGLHRARPVRRDDDARTLRLRHDGRAPRRRARGEGGRHLDRRRRRPDRRPARRPRGAAPDRASPTARRRR